MNGNKQIRLIRCFMGIFCGLLCAGISKDAPAQTKVYQDKIVWVFGWGLGSDNDVNEIKKVIDTAAKSGFNAVMMSAGMDTLCKHSPDYLRRIKEILQYCEANKMEFIPALFSVGYGGGVLSHDHNLAEGLPVNDALYVVSNKIASFAPEQGDVLKNGGFEEYGGNVFAGYRFHDQPGEISFVDTRIYHSGKASIRLENFRANQYGHGRVMQEIKVIPHRCYLVSVWVKTENLQPADAFNITVLGGNRSLAPRRFNLPSTTDWRKITMVFNSMDHDKVRVYAGLWGGRSGKVWIDDWSVKEIGALNVLKRPGTPVTVKSADLKTTYVEGVDYEPLADKEFSFQRWDREPLKFRLTQNSRIKDGERLRISWYHPMVIHDSQVTVCMGEPALYEIYDHEARLLSEIVKPKRVMLNMDEIRMGGTCKACEGKNIAQLLGECVTRQCQTIRKYIPNAKIYIWSDMFDPNHNAHSDYYLVKGDFTGSHKYIPKDIIIAVWGGAPREKSLKFFENEGFETLIACYYDAKDLEEVKGWIKFAKDTKNVRGFMYTPWRKSYSLLPEFGKLINQN